MLMEVPHPEQVSPLYKPEPILAHYDEIIGNKT